MATSGMTCPLSPYIPHREPHPTPSDRCSPVPRVCVSIFVRANELSTLNSSQEEHLHKISTSINSIPSPQPPPPPDSSTLFCSSVHVQACCDCTDGCRDPTVCTCLRLQAAEDGTCTTETCTTKTCSTKTCTTTGFGRNYSDEGLLLQLPRAIYECHAG